MGFRQTLADTVSANFDAFDSDKNDYVDKIELENAKANEKLSAEARQAAGTLAANYADATNLAKPLWDPDLHNRGGMKESFALQRAFGGEGDGEFRREGFSRRDLKVLNLLANPDELKMTIDREREIERATELQDEIRDVAISGAGLLTSGFLFSQLSKAGSRLGLVGRLGAMGTTLALTVIESDRAYQSHLARNNSRVVPALEREATWLGTKVDSWNKPSEV